MTNKYTIVLNDDELYTCRNALIGLHIDTGSKLAEELHYRLCDTQPDDPNAENDVSNALRLALIDNQYWRLTTQGTVLLLVARYVKESSGDEFWDYANEGLLYGNISKREIAESVGVHVRTVQKWFKTRKINDEMLANLRIALADAFNEAGLEAIEIAKQFDISGEVKNV